MLKEQELADPKSCINRADDGEMTFVLLARDAAAPETIRNWAMRRVWLGRNEITDPQIQEALSCAAEMEIQYAKRNC